MRIPVVCPDQTSCLIGSAAVGSVRVSSEEHERSSTVKSSDEAEVVSWGFSHRLKSKTYTTNSAIMILGS